MYLMHQIAPRDRGNSPGVINLDQVDQEIGRIVAIAKCHGRACLARADVGDVNYDSRDTPIRCINERVAKTCSASVPGQILPISNNTLGESRCEIAYYFALSSERNPICIWTLI